MNYPAAPNSGISAVDLESSQKRFILELELSAAEVLNTGE
jgi:hypothetical protein